MILSIILFYNGKVKIIDVAKCSGSLCKNFDVILVEKCSFLFIIYSFIYLKHLLYLKMVWKLSREHCLHSGVSFYFSPLLLSSNANVPFSLFKERKKKVTYKVVMCKDWRILFPIRAWTLQRQEEPLRGKPMSVSGSP